jgi:N-acetylneuraminate synthase
MRQLFGCEVGLSDHTMGMGAAIAAVALGATVVEKHFTLRRADGGVDSAFSAEPEEINTLVTETERAWQSLGEVRYGATESEIKSKQYRRSIYITRDTKAGEVLRPDNIRVIRPARGLPPAELDRVLGRVLRKDAKRGTPLSWDLI